MQEVKEPEHKPQKKPLIFYYLVCLVVVLLLNALLFPSMNERRVTEVGYNAFLDMIDKGVVTEVAYNEQESQYVFIAKIGEEQIPALFKTGVWPEDGQRLLEQLRAHDEIKFSASIPTEASPIITFLVNWILPIFIFLLIGNLLSRMMMKKMGGAGGLGNAMQFGKSGAKVYVEDAQTGIKFKDVAGQEEAKDSLKEVVDFLHNPEKYSEIGATLPKGMLLVGPPGTGKTMLAKAVAGEANVPFFSISGSEFVEMFVGMGAAKVRDLFKQANEKAPCIVFIDEIDAIGKKRDNSGMGGNDEREQTLNQLLAEMDGFDGKKGVVMLAATNRPDSLDPALLRPGRFDRRIPVELPDLLGRQAILLVHAAKVKCEDKIDWNKIARSTAGASGAELANIINEAALTAVRRGRKLVSQRDIEDSVETVIAGAERKSAVVSESDKKIIAYHEIGHALVAALQTHSAPVTKITIVPRTSGALGYTMQVDEGEKLLMGKTEILNKIATFTGGRCAEEILLGKDNVTTGASNDIEQATRLARALITRYGMSEEFGMVALETVTNQYLGGDTSLQCSAETAARIDEKVVGIVDAAYKKAFQLLKDNSKKLDELAAFLIKRETITGEEFMEILNRKEALPEPKPIILGDNTNNEN